MRSLIGKGGTMRKYIEIAGCVFLLLFCPDSYSINIRDALKQKIIKVDVRWKYMENAESASRVHGTNLRVTIQNLSGQSITVEVPCGSLFTASDSADQNMIITEDMKFVLQPNAHSTKYAHGYCCEASDHSPDENEQFLIKKPAPDKLVKLTEFIRDNKIEGYGVQRAVWCITNNYDLWDINVPDSGMTAELIKYTGELKGFSEPDISKAIKKAFKNSGKVFEQMINVEVPVEDDMHIWIMIQGINNNTIRYVAMDQPVTKGTYKREFGVSSLDMGAGTFYVRVYSKKGFMAEKQFTLAK